MRKRQVASGKVEDAVRSKRALALRIVRSKRASRGSGISFSAITDILRMAKGGGQDIEMVDARDVDRADVEAMEVSTGVGQVFAEDTSTATMMHVDLPDIDFPNDEYNDQMFLEDLDEDAYEVDELASEEFPTEGEIAPVPANGCRAMVASEGTGSHSSLAQSSGSCSGVVLPLRGFRDAPDPHLVKAGKAEEKTKSERNNMWALRRADALRSALGWDMSIKFGDLPLKVIDELLAELFTRVTKVDGTDFPSQSLANMCNSFNRVIRRASNFRSVNGGGYRVERDFQIKYHPAFAKTRLVLDAAIKKSARDGNNKKRKKVEFLTEKMEEAIFEDIDHQVTDPVGCQKRFAAQFMIQCGVRGGVELWDMERNDVHVLVDSKGQDYLKFKERHSKSNDYGLDRYNEENFRETYHSYNADFILTAKQYLRHLPPLEEGVSPFLFLSPIHHPASVIWYNRALKVSKDKCTNWLKNMLKIVGMPVDMFTNKSARVTLVTRMCAKGVPDEVGRRVTGHHTSSGYRRYDRTQGLQVEAAVKVTHTPGLSYEEALADCSKEFVEDKLVGKETNLRPLVAKCTGTAPTLAITSLQASKNSELVMTDSRKGKEVLQVGNNATVKASKCTFTSSATAKDDQSEQSDKWLRLFGPSIDWDSAVKNDPVLARHLGGPVNVTSNTGQIGIAPGCNFANCQVTVIINQKDKEGESEKENMAPK